MSRRTLALVFVGVSAWALLGAGVRATYGARVTADEPQYLLSAISLGEDGDLDISDELAAQRWRDFHRSELPRQTEPRADGSELSPHDPLFPVLLTPGVAITGALAGARITMALVAGALAVVLLWTSVVRLGVRPRVATLTVLAFVLPAPLAAYGDQIYPELPAALAVALAAAALLGPGQPVARTRRATVVWVLAVVALPWLGVKYVGVAAALAIVGLWTDRGRLRPVLAVLGVAGVAYLVFHQRVYGGWTVYAAGDHFVGGELTVVGNHPDYLGRTVRLLGLLVDRDFGLAAWAPGWLLAVPAVAASARRRDRVAATLTFPLAVGWATATWVALTMHGWWWPGRQVVVVLPLAVLAVATLLDGRPRLQVATLAAGVVGAATWLWVAAEATVGDLRLIVDFDRTTNPWLRAWRVLLPDERVAGAGTAIGNALWLVLVVVLAVAGWRAAGRGSAGGDEDPLARERPDADRVAVDLDRRGAVR